MMYEEIVTPGFNGEDYIVIKKIDDDGDVSFIPVDEANSDYQQYLLWLEEDELPAS